MRKGSKLTVEQKRRVSKGVRKHNAKVMETVEHYAALIARNQELEERYRELEEDRKFREKIEAKSAVELRNEGRKEEHEFQKKWEAKNP